MGDSLRSIYSNFRMNPSDMLIRFKVSSKLDSDDPKK